MSSLEGACENDSSRRNLDSRRALSVDGAERAADAIALVERVRRRLAEYRQAIEHEPSPEPETED